MGLFVCVKKAPGKADGPFVATTPVTLPSFVMRSVPQVLRSSVCPLSLYLPMKLLIQPALRPE